MEARNESSEMPADPPAVPPEAKASLNDVGTVFPEVEEHMSIDFPRLEEMESKSPICI